MNKRWLVFPLIVILVLFCAAAAAQEEAGWTILWYLCGTDLETEDGAATYNLEQAMDGMASGDVNVVIVTGGTDEWQNDIVSNDEIGIYMLNGQGGGMTKLSKLKDRNMADADLLASMVQQVFTLYPAENTMLILWDHGGGSVGGFAVDERTEDSISLYELGEALEQSGKHLDMIGFDACLMASLETANTLAPYAEYMIASQELEPGGGWNYKDLMAAISGNPSITPAALGKIICDSYLEHCIEWDDKEIATLSLVNLSKIPALVEAFDAMAWQLTGIAGNPASIQAYRQDVSKARNFGGNNRSEGYTHMVDLGELVLNTEGVWDETGLTVLDALFDAVEYHIDGSTYQKSNGLSVFYPFTTDSEVSDACATVAQAPVSKAYMRFIGAMVPSWSVPEDMNQFVSEQPVYTAVATEEPAAVAVETLAAQEAAVEEETTVTQLNPDDYAVTFTTEIDEYGYYALYVDSGLDIVQDVQFALYLIDEEEEAAILLGTDNDIDAYWDEGVFYDNFRGVWLTINGEYCSPILIDSQDDYNLYTIPIERNGKRTNLRVLFVVESEDDEGVTGSYQVLGVWDGNDGETGVAARDIKPLEEGDVILPLFDAYPLYDENGGSEEWSSYEIVAGKDGEITLEEQELFDGEYYYTFILTDIFGQEYQSDVVSLFMEGDEFYFDEGY